MRIRFFHAAVCATIVLFLISSAWAADSFSAPAQFDFGKGDSSVQVDVKAEGPFGINIPVSLNPNPVPITGILKINTLNESTGAFEGELQNLKGQTEIKVVGLFELDATVTLNGGVSGVFQWNQDRVTVFATSVSGIAEIEGQTETLPSVEFVMNGTYSNGKLSIQHQGSYSYSYQGQDFDLSLAVDLEATLEELDGSSITSSDFSGCWKGTWTSTQYSETGNVTAQFCQSGNTLTGEAFLTNTDAGDVRVPVSGTVNSDILTLSTEYDYEGHHADTSFTQGTLSGNTLSGTYTENVDGSAYDQGTFTLTRVSDTTSETDGVWKGGDGSWFIQRYQHGGALVIFSKDLSSFTVYGIDSATGTDWTSNPDMELGRYSLRIVFTSSTGATATVTDLTSQTSKDYVLSKFAGIPPCDEFTQTDGVWKGDPGSVFIQRYTHCGALIILTRDMKEYEVYGVDSSLGIQWMSNPEMNNGKTSVDIDFLSQSQCKFTIHDIASSTSQAYTLSLFAGTQ